MAISSDMNVDLALPRGWHELNDRQLRYAYRLIAADLHPDAIKAICLMHWSGCKVVTRYGDDAYLLAKRRPRRISFKATPLQIAELLPTLDWLSELPTMPVRPSRLRRRNALPADFSEVPFEKFIICENLYQGFLATKQDALLDELAAVLYPPRLPLAGLRSPLSTVDRLAVFYWFASLKVYLAARFPDFFRPTEEESANLLGTAPTTMGDRLRQSVDAQIRALTKGDITKESVVLSLDTHRALTELNAQAREYRELNAKSNAK